MRNVKNKNINILCDPETSKPIFRKEVIDLKSTREIEDELRLKLNINSQNITITALWNIENTRYFFLEIGFIPILIKEIKIHLINGKYFLKLGKISINPFLEFKKNNNSIYHSYQKNIKLKSSFFNNKIKYSKDYIVELMSSEGQTIIPFAKLYEDRVFIALDIDFFALENLLNKNKDKNKNLNIIAVCADILVLPFQKNTLDLIYSNSFHHIPTEAVNVWNNCYSLLKHNGIFAGVETQGIFSKVIVCLINFIPEKILPNLFRGIKKENNLLKKWLSVSLSKRIKRSNIPNESWNVSKSIFHISYFFKNIN